MGRKGVGSIFCKLTNFIHLVKTKFFFNSSISQNKSLQIIFHFTVQKFTCICITKLRKYYKEV